MFKLVRYFSLASAAVILFVAVALGVFHRHNAVQELIRAEEGKNVALARSFANSVWPRFSGYVTSATGTDGLALRATPETRELQAALRSLTAGLQVLRVKIYNLDGLVVYSSKLDQIGEDKSLNPGFRIAALDGEAASTLVYHGTFDAFEGVIRRRDLVESYIPVHRADGSVEAVFELYCDVTQLMARIDRSTIEHVSVFLAAFGILYVVLFLVVRRADRILRAQHTALEHEIDERRIAQTALQEANRNLEEQGKERTQELRKLSQAVEQSPSVVMITDAEGRIEYVNPRFEEVTGYAAREAVGRNPRFLGSGFLPAGRYEEMWQAITKGREWRGELNNRKKDGSLFWEAATISPLTAADGTITHFVAVKEDITTRKQYEERLLRQTHFDDLTGLPNRILAFDRLSQALTRAHPINPVVAVLVIDLDNFRRVTETVGHATGDRLLQAAAARISGSVKASDTVARLGGDEFVVVLSDLDDGIRAETVAGNILEACAEPYDVDGNEMFVTASIGITASPADGHDPHVLMRNADAAMYRAKGEGRNTFRFFTPKMNQQATERMRMERDLRRALKRGELSVHYQPLIDNATGNVVGAEALVRWHSPQFGSVSPERFVPLAEEMGLIGDIGEWVLATACRDGAAWRTRDGGPMTVCVNISGRQFNGHDLAETIVRILDATDFHPENLELEITENVLLDDSPETARAIRYLSDRGIRFAIDDFGTGYSSLAYLRRYPFTTLKIDRSFVQDIAGDADTAALVQSIIALAEIMDLKVVGEGVETEGQLEVLRAARCAVSQGWLFSKAMPALDFALFLDHRNSPHFALDLAGD